MIKRDFSKCVIRLRRKKAAEEMGSGRGEIKRDSYKSTLIHQLVHSVVEYQMRIPTNLSYPYSKRSV